MGGAYGTGGKENRKIAMDEKEMETACLPIMHTVHILAVHLWAYLCKHAIQMLQQSNWSVLRKGSDRIIKYVQQLPR